MSESNIMTVSDFVDIQMTPDAAEALEIHNRIITSIRTAAEALVQLCENLKLMRDNKAYLDLGFDSFEQYTEKACGIKKRQAYNYIETYEKLGIPFMQSNAQLGITKLQFLTDVCAVDRDQFTEENDLDGMTVAEVKALVDKNRQLGEQLNLLTDELDETKALLTEQKYQADDVEDEQGEYIQKLEEQIKELKARPTEVAVQEPSEEDIAAAVAARTKELEERHAHELKKLERENKLKIIDAKKKAAKKAAADRAKEIAAAENRAAEKVRGEFEGLMKTAEEKEAAARKAAEEAARRLDKNADADLVKASLFFGEAQRQLDQFITSAASIAENDSEKGAKLKALAISVLEKYIAKLK